MAPCLSDRWPGAGAEVDVTLLVLEREAAQADSGKHTQADTWIRHVAVQCFGLDISCAGLSNQVHVHEKVTVYTAV